MQDVEWSIFPRDIGSFTLVKDKNTPSITVSCRSHKCILCSKVKFYNVPCLLKRFGKSCLQWRSSLPFPFIPILFMLQALPPLSIIIRFVCKTLNSCLHLGLFVVKYLALRDFIQHVHCLSQVWTTFYKPKDVCGSSSYYSCSVVV